MTGCCCLFKSAWSLVYSETFIFNLQYQYLWLNSIIKQDIYLLHLFCTVEVFFADQSLLLKEAQWFLVYMLGFYLILDTGADMLLSLL